MINHFDVIELGTGNAGMAAAGVARAAGQELRAAVAAAGRARMRPTVLTTLTTIGGLLPLSLFGGAADADQPIPAIGPIERERINPLGSSIAIGHPFAATGARIVTTLANQMKRTDARYGLVSICGAGATAAAVLLERS